VEADSNAIWSPDEVCDILEAEADDARIVPAFEFSYKQAVQTGDVYLALDPMGKDPTSTCCEDLVLTVQLPDAETANDIDVDLTDSSITLLTSKQYDAVHYNGFANGVGTRCSVSQLVQSAQYIPASQG
jgi:dynein assembly factor 6, axonemal